MELADIPFSPFFLFLVAPTYIATLECEFPLSFFPESGPKETALHADLYRPFILFKTGVLFL